MGLGPLVPPLDELSAIPFHQLLGRGLVDALDSSQFCTLILTDGNPVGPCHLTTQVYCPASGGCYKGGDSRPPSE